MTREEAEARIAEKIVDKARADIHIRVYGNVSSIEGNVNHVGLLMAMSALGTTFIKSRMEEGIDLETCKGSLQAAVRQAIANATNED